MSDSRSQQFRRNTELEKLLRQLNRDLQPSEKTLLDHYREKAPEYPLILLVGPLRSGTTLLSQWLANTGIVAYPTNLLSRFYQAPILGAKIQLLLTDPRFNFRDELIEFNQPLEYESENGKTKGILGPNEFWYFWRRFLADSERDIWTDDELRQTMDIETLTAELNGITDVFAKPFAAKGMLFNYNIPFLDSVLEKVLFIQLKRDPVANVASVLDARVRQLESNRAWYSFKIPEYEDLKNLDPISQCAGQVHFIDKAVTQGMSVVGEPRKLVVQYEAFCTNPRKVFEELTQKLGVTNRGYSGPSQFTPTRSSITDDYLAITRAVEQFMGL